jgi:Arc/MetJ-type ribon-helix-helix transcriptional regulator
MSRMSVNLSPEMEKLIEETAQNENISKGDVIRRAFALLKVSETEKKHGRFLAVAQEEKNSGSKSHIEVIGKIIGI